jgi:hypothetical protein
MQGTPLVAHTRGSQDLPHPPIYCALEITDSQPIRFVSFLSRDVKACTQWAHRLYFPEARFWTMFGLPNHRKSMQYRSPASAFNRPEAAARPMSGGMAPGKAPTRTHNGASLFSGVYNSTHRR